MNFAAQSVLRRGLVLGLFGLWLVPQLTVAQEFTPEMLRAASQQTGLSEAELLRRYRGQSAAPTQAGLAAPKPGRTSMEGIDDSRPFRDTGERVVLPYTQVVKGSPASASATTSANTKRFYGDDFFHLDQDFFTPPSFGPLSPDHRLGVGDEVVINVWGGVDLKLTRVVDRDGTILLPRVGKVLCAGRTLAEVDESVRKHLAQIHSSIELDADGESSDGATYVEVTLGQLRAMRVFVVGQAVRPGSYELSSVSTVLTALYAAGGPALTGTYRAIEVVRGGETVGTFDLYSYLMGGSRSQDILLQEGDTVFVGDRGVSVRLNGGVRRPMYYELVAGETLADVLGYAGGFTATAAPEVIHIRRILPPALRQAGQPDQVYLDVPFDAASLRAITGQPVAVLDGDAIRIDAIGDRQGNWVKVEGSVKRPGRYELRPGMTVADLLEAAEGLWPDALMERAVIDRTSADLTYSALTVALAEVLDGRAAPVPLQSRDVLHVFPRWGLQE